MLSRCNHTSRALRIASKLVVLDANLSVKVLRSAIQECNSSKVDSKCTIFSESVLFKRTPLVLLYVFCALTANYSR